MRTLAVLLILSGLAVTPPAWADAPLPPCGEDAVTPAPPPPDAPPVIRTWQRGDLPDGWQPPACAGWSRPGFRLMTAISGQFDPPGGAADPRLFLSRLASVSHMAGIRFWAVLNHSWQVLIRDAHALNGPPPGTPRPDFSDAELTPGHTLMYSETDNGSGEDQYRMRVLERTPTRLVVTTENASTIRYLLFPLFHPGDLQVLYVLQQQPDQHWLFYSLTRVGAGASGLTDGHAPSMINRAVAMYRYLAGIPTDQDPPAAR